MAYNTYNFSEESYLTFYDIKIFKKAKEMCYPTPSWIKVSFRKTRIIENRDRYLRVTKYLV